MDATVWLYWLGGQALGGAGVAVVLWALLGDRLLKGHTKRRCPKCWHDLSATPGLTCPECGKAARSEAGLFRSRKRRRLAAVGVVGVVLGTGVIAWPQLRGRYWFLLVPKPVIAAVWPELPAGPDPFQTYFVIGNTVGPDAKSRLTSLAIAWSSARVLRSESAGPRANLALELLAKGGVRSEAADVVLPEILALDPGPIGLMGTSELQKNALAYVEETYAPIERFDFLEAQWLKRTKTSVPVIEPALLKATGTDARLIKRWIDLCADKPFPTSTVWPRFHEPEWSDWWNRAIPVLIQAMVEAPPANARSSFVNFLRFGLSEWAQALGRCVSLNELEPLLTRAKVSDEVGRLLLGAFEQVRLKGLSSRLLTIARDERGEAGEAFAVALTRRAFAGAEPVSDEVASFLVDRVKIGDEAQIAAAMSALERAPVSTVPRLVELLGHASVEVRLHAIRVLSGFKPQPIESCVAIRRLAEDPAETDAVRAAARAALGSCPEPAPFGEPTDPK